MPRLFAIVERLFWLIVWVFLALILGNYLFNWMRNGSFGPFSNFANWVENRAAPG